MTNKKIYWVIRLSIGSVLLALLIYLISQNAKAISLNGQLYAATNDALFLEIKERLELEIYIYVLICGAVVVSTVYVTDLFFKYRNIAYKKNIRILLCEVVLSCVVVFVLNFVFLTRPNIYAIGKFISLTYTIGLLFFVWYYQKEYAKNEKRNKSAEVSNGQKENEEEKAIKEQETEISDTK
jgi:hypothetical protein